MSVSEQDTSEWTLLDGSDTESSSSSGISIIDISNEQDPTSPGFEVDNEDLNENNSNDFDDDRDEDLQMALALSMQNHQTQESSSIEHEGARDGNSNIVCWKGTVSSGSLFTAQWQVHLPGVQDEVMTMDAWGDRIFLSKTCDGKCIHRKITPIQNALSIHDGIDYSIQITHLCAPSKSGHFTEYWRLRNMFGHLVGPVLEIQANVISETNNASASRLAFRSRKRSFTEVDAGDFKAEVLNQGLIQKQFEDGIPPKTYFQYTWKLQNTGTLTWKPPFALERVNGDWCTEGGTQFAITNQKRKIVVGAILPNATVNVSLFKLCSKEETGLHEEMWRLTSTTHGHTLADRLPLQILIMGESTTISSVGEDGEQQNDDV